MRVLALVAALLLTPAQAGGAVVFAGGYGRDGVVRVDLRAGTHRPIYTLGSPTFMVADPARGLLYVTSELSGGRANLRVITSEGRERARVWAGGDSPVAMALNPSRTRLAVANYDGSVALLGLSPAGLPGPPLAIARTAGKGAHPVRQKSSHPHGVTFSPSGSLLYAADLGGDQILTYDLGPGADTLRPLPAVPMPPGSGPRQVVLSGSFALVPAELDGHVDVLRVDAAGALSPLDRLSLGAGAPSELAVHPGGAWAVALVRGPDTCFVLRLESAVPSVHGSTPCNGRPRSLRWANDGRLYVAAQAGNRIDAYDFDATTGVLVRAGPVAPVRGAAGLAVMAT